MMGLERGKFHFSQGVCLSRFHFANGQDLSLRQICEAGADGLPTLGGDIEGNGLERSPGSRSLKSGEIVEAQVVVPMLMGEQHAVDPPPRLPGELLGNIGSAVDQKVRLA